MSLCRTSASRRARKRQHPKGLGQLWHPSCVSSARRTPRRKSGQRSLLAVLQLIYRDVQLTLQEAHLTPDKMIHDRHPSLLADYLSEQQIGKYPQAFKSSAVRSSPPTLEELKAKGDRLAGKEAVPVLDDEEDDDPLEGLGMDASDDEEMEGVIRPRQGAAGMARPVMSASAEMVQAKPKPKAKCSASQASAPSLRVRDKSQPTVKVEQVKTEPAEASGQKENRRSGSPVPSVAPSAASSKTKDKDKDVPLPEGAELDQEMSRVQQKLGPPFQPCLQSLVIQRHLAGEKLGVRLVAAKKLLDRLKAPGSGGARLLLDNRIQICEKAALLAAGTKKLQDDVLHTAVTVVSRAHVEIPLPVRLDLAERFGLGLMKEVLEASNGKDPLSAIEKPVDKFLKFLLPCKTYKLNQDDVMRPRFANLMATMVATHAEQMEACELTEELQLKERHDDEWRATAMSLCDSFFNDAFCDLLTAGEKKAPIVKALCSQLISRESDLDLIEFGSHYPPDPVDDNLKRVSRVCLCLTSLLDPMDDGPGKMEHVAAVKTSSANEHMEATVRTLLNNGGFWCLLAEEQAKKAATSHTAKPLLTELTQKLTAGVDSRVDLAMDDVKLCIEKLPELRQKLRDGATSCIEPVLLKRGRRDCGCGHPRDLWPACEPTRSLDIDEWAVAFHKREGCAGHASQAGGVSEEEQDLPRHCGLRGGTPGPCLPHGCKRGGDPKD
ncbi:unnamed protein product [Symbiodinium necroappetens]|uniref:Uncharacterized protein n=1 Tax=Symbiodinium necroappetens TaxID=1628268 RepID=A0A812PLQ2_9DINO|nr:unnamed protein product [Symbiodinium necroappetens]